MNQFKNFSTYPRLLHARLQGGGPSPAAARAIAFAVIACVLVAAAILAFMDNSLSGPGDQLHYYEQAGRLIPFTDHFYGPSYYVALRLAHSLQLSWFASGKFVAFISACVYLLLSDRLFKAVLGGSARWFALALLALNVQVISGAYSTATIMYGSVWIVGATVLLARADVTVTRQWIIAGLLFGFAALARYQAFGFVLGAVVGAMFLPVTLRRRMILGACLIVGAAIPVLLWNGWLTAVQGSPPANWNFTNLMSALGEFKSFCDVQPLVAKYGSLGKVLRANPANFFKIVSFAILQLARFPLDGGVALFGWVSAWLLPGLVVAMLRRSTYAPWFMAYAVGLLLTGLTGTDWAWYYVPTLPLLVYLIALALESPGALHADGRTLVAAGWLFALLSSAAWTLWKVPADFHEHAWGEWGQTRDYLNRLATPSMLVSSTASSLAYGARFRFIDFDDLMHCNDTANYVARLRAQGVTHLVVTERHSLFEYPSEKVLLDDSGAGIPAGLVRDTLITQPKRVAVLRVLP